MPRGEGGEGVEDAVTLADAARTRPVGEAIVLRARWATSRKDLQFKVVVF